MTYLAFDMDGTLYDCSGIVADAFQEGIRRFEKPGRKNITVPEKESIIIVLGQPVELIFKTLFPELNGQELLEINDFCTNTLIEMIKAGGGSLIDDVYPNLEKLYKEGYGMFIASNGRPEYLDAILSATGIEKFFLKPVVTIDGKIKTKGDIVRHYMEETVRDNIFIMIGDRASDRTAAAENDVPFIGCNFGYGGYELAGSKWLAADFNEVYHIIKKIEKEQAS